MSSRSIVRASYQRANHRLIPKDFFLHRRYASTASTITGQSFNSNTQARRSLPQFVFGAVCLAIGYASGLPIREYLFPATLVTPGSEEDTVLLARLTHQIDTLPIVQRLRAKHHEGLATKKENVQSAAQSINGTGVENDEEGQWRELLIETLAECEKDVVDGIDARSINVLGRRVPEGRTLTQKTMGGARGLGVQRVFWNAERRQLLAVVWYGGGISGWPKVTHGGAIATVLDEVLSRVVAGPSNNLESIPSASSLALTYAKPTFANNFYVLRANISIQSSELQPVFVDSFPTKATSWWTWISPAKDMTKKSQETGGPSIEVQGVMENLDGKVCVKATATWELKDITHVLPDEVPPTWLRDP